MGRRGSRFAARTLTARTMAVGIVVAGGVVLTATPSAAAVTPCDWTRIDAMENSDAGEETITTDGSLVMFSSSNDIAGLNPEQDAEVFLYDVEADEITKLTEANAFTPAERVGPAAMAEDGSTVAYVEWGDDPAQLRLIDLETMDDTAVVQVGEGPFESTEAIDISDDGQVVAFATYADLVGDNADGNLEVYRYDVAADDLQQVTDTTGAVENGGFRGPVRLDGDGNRLFFASNADRDDPSDGALDVFVYDAGLDVLTNLTDDDPDDATSGHPNPDASGDRVVFQTDPDGTDSGPERFSLIIADLEADASGIASSRIVPGDPSTDDGIAGGRLDATGTVLLAHTEADLTGDNPDDEQHLFRELELNQTLTQVAETIDNVPNGDSWDVSANGRVIVVKSPSPLDGQPVAVSDLFVGQCRTFPDVGTGNQFLEDIEWMAAERISTGYADGTYRPATAVSRQAMSAFMYRLAGSPAFTDPTTATFADVSLTHPFSTEIEWMAAEAITTGFPGTPKPTYRPATAVSRQAMSAFMYRLAGSPAFTDPTTATFADVSLTHPFSTEIEWMAAEAITTGFPGTPKPTYRPATAVSRQAMSAFMHRLADGPGVGIGTP